MLKKHKINFKKICYFIYLPKMQSLFPIKFDQKLCLSDLICIEEQKEKIILNTENFINNKPSNDVLLWGARGMGKSSLVKTIIKYFFEKKKNIFLIEILNFNLNALPEIIYFLNNFDFKFIIFIDDLSLNFNEKDFILFKSLVEGSTIRNPEKIKFYVTSNLRHLSNKKSEDEESFIDIETKENTDNLISLSDRFGLWIGFHNSDKKKYLDIVNYYLKKSKIITSNKLIDAAMQWSLEKGNYSGRTAFQFVSNLISQKKI